MKRAQSKPTRILTTRRPPYRVEREDKPAYVRFERKRVANDFRSLVEELNAKGERE